VDEADQHERAVTENERNFDMAYIKPMSPTKRRILQNMADGLRWNLDLDGQHQAGGVSGVLSSLYKLGYVTNDWKITDAGRVALADAK
jgi:hypothetical protein